MRDTKFSSTEH